MAKYLTVVPACGRDYKSAKEVKKDWDEGMDFLIQDVGSSDNGRYVNKAQLEGGETVNIQYKDMRQVLVVKPGKVTKKAAEATPEEDPFGVADHVIGLTKTEHAEMHGFDKLDPMQADFDSAIRALADLVTNRNVEKVSGILTPKARKLLKEKLLSYGHQGVARMIP